VGQAQHRRRTRSTGSSRRKSCHDPVRESSRIRLIPEPPGGETIEFALAPDGKSVATRSSDGRIAIRDLGDDRGVRRTVHHQRDPTRGLAFSPDGRTLDLGRIPSGILVYDLAQKRPGVLLAEPDYAIRTLAVSADGRSLAASAERDSEILLWDIEAGRVRTTLRGRHPAVSLAFSPDGRSPAAREKEELRVTLWDLDSGRFRSIRSGTFGLSHRSPSRPKEACWPPPPRASPRCGSGTRGWGSWGSRSLGMPAAPWPSVFPGWQVARDLGQ
jgi:WD40 repeat protein